MFNTLKRTWNAYVERRTYCCQVYAPSTDSKKNGIRHMRKNTTNFPNAKIKQVHLTNKYLLQPAFGFQKELSSR